MLMGRMDLASEMGNVIWGDSREAMVTEEELVWGGEDWDEVLDCGGEGCRGVTDCGGVGLEGACEPLEAGVAEVWSGGLGGWGSERLAEGEVGKAGEENTNCLFCGVWCKT
jgi:hypothetical protein